MKANACTVILGAYEVFRNASEKLWHSVCLLLLLEHFKILQEYFNLTAKVSKLHYNLNP